MRLCVVILVASVAAAASGIARFTFASPAARVWLDAIFLFSTAVAVVCAVTLIAAFGGARLMHHFHHQESPEQEGRHHNLRPEDRPPS